MEVMEDLMLTSTEAARLFGISRPSFYDFAERHGIENAAKFNGARKHQERRYKFADIARVYREVYNTDLTREEIERLRKAAQGGGD